MCERCQALPAAAPLVREFRLACEDARSLGYDPKVLSRPLPHVTSPIYKNVKSQQSAQEIQLRARIQRALRGLKKFHQEWKEQQDGGNSKSG